MHTWGYNPFIFAHAHFQGFCLSKCFFVFLAVSSSKPFSSPSGPPSAPRNAISNVNETSVFLEWSIPMDTGGRKDVRYNVICRQVLPDGRGLEECGPNVRFLPRRTGLSNTSVMVADLQSHTNYSFLLEAVNGVSDLAKGHAKQYVSLNVTTNQAGMFRQIWLIITFTIPVHSSIWTYPEFSSKSQMFCHNCFFSTLI